MNRFVSLLSGTCISLISQAGFAQAPANGALAEKSAQPVADNPVGSGIEDIVVTAQRRSESIQKVPAAITALSGESLKRLGIADASGLVNAVPNINIATQNNNVLIGIRGIYSITATTANGSPEIAVSADGVYQSRASAIAGTFFDINRIEVLRGPQGTLYGRNATGGSINIITNKPDPAGLSAHLSLGAGNYDEYSASGFINMPVGEQTAVRASFNFLKHDGYLGGYYDDADNKAGRIQLLTKPVDNLSILLSGYLFRQDGHGGSDVLSPYVTKDHWANTASYPLDGSQNNRHWGANGQLDWDLGPATLTYIPAYLRVGLTMAPYYSGGVQQYLRHISHQYTQELRLASSDQSQAQGHLKWVGGFFWLRENQNYHLVIPALLQDIDTRLKATSYAAFGQATYAVTDSIRVSGGLRYTRDESSQMGTGSNFGAPVPIAGADKYSNLGWKAGIDTDISPNSIVYASASSGYKAGGQWTGGVTGNNFRPEKIIAYELGSKNKLFSGSLIANAAAFLYDYKGYQATTILFLPGSGFVGATFNAGNARIYGAELETIWKPTSADQVDFNLTIEKATFRNFLIPPTTDLSGNDLPNVSRLSLSGGYQHSFAIGDSGMVTARVHTRYASRYYADFYNSLPSRQKAQTITDASVTYAIDGPWSVTAYVKNIEKNSSKTYVLTGIATSSSTIAAPRTYGIRLDFDFR